MKRALFLVLGLFCAGAVHAQSGQPFIIRSVVAGGGATLSSSNRFQLSSTLGQPVVGTIAGGRFSMQQGFWFRRAPMIIAASRVGADFVFTLQTELGKTYAMQYADSYSSPNWQNLSILIGNGSVQSVTNAAPSAAQRYYRVLEQ